MADESKCERCGACCIVFHIERARELPEGFTLMGDFPETAKPAGEPCRYLSFKNRKAVCANYSERWEQCRIFSCQSREFYQREDLARVAELLEKARREIRGGKFEPVS